MIKVEINEIEQSNGDMLAFKLIDLEQCVG